MDNNNTKLYFEIDKLLDIMENSITKLDSLIQSHQQALVIHHFYNNENDLTYPYQPDKDHNT